MVGQQQQLWILSLIHHQELDDEGGPEYMIQVAEMENTELNELESIEAPVMKR